MSRKREDHAKYAAREQGLKRYVSDRPCKEGHIGERFTINGRCVACNMAAYRERYPAGAGRYDPAYFQSNKDREHARARAWRAANLEASRERTRRWLADNPERRRAKNLEYQARKKGAEGSFTPADIEAIYKAQRGKCAAPHCRKSLRGIYEIDHIQALSKGGSNWPSNLQLLCPSCNSSKNAKDRIDWAREHGSLL